MKEAQHQKLEVLKKLKAAGTALKYHREKHRIFLKNTAELENRIQDAEDKVNTAIVIDIVQPNIDP